MRWLFLPILVLAIFWSSRATVDSCKVCGSRPRAPSHGGSMRTVGAVDVQPGSWPWIVSLQLPAFTGHKHMCAGSLITAHWVLTAAHCFGNNKSLPRWRAVIGATRLSALGPEVHMRHIKQVVLHEAYDPDQQINDIALMELDQPIKCNDYIQPACIPDSSVRLSKLTACFISGWGVVKKYSSEPTAVMKEARVNLFPLKMCNSSSWYNGSIKEHNLCAGYEGGINSCQGDSGGPLMCREASQPLWVIGLTSWGHGCVRPHNPGVYTSTQHFFDWIKGWVGPMPEPPPTLKSPDSISVEHQPSSRSYLRPLSWPLAAVQSKPQSQPTPTPTPTSEGRLQPQPKPKEQPQPEPELIPRGSPQPKPPSKTQGLPEAKSQPTAQGTLQPTLHFQSKPELPPQGHPQIRPQPKPPGLSQPKPQPKPQVRPQPKPQSHPQLRPQPKPQLKPQGHPPSKHQWKLQAHPLPKPQSHPHPKPQPKYPGHPQTKPQLELQRRPQHRPQPKPQGQLHPRPKPNPQGWPKPKPQPKLQARPQAKPHYKPLGKLQAKPQPRPLLQPKPQEHLQPKQQHKLQGKPQPKPQGGHPQLKPHPKLQGHLSPAGLAQPIHPKLQRQPRPHSEPQSHFKSRPQSKPPASKLRLKPRPKHKGREQPEPPKGQLQPKPKESWKPKHRLTLQTSAETNSTVATFFKLLQKFMHVVSQGKGFAWPKVTHMELTAEANMTAQDSKQPSVTSLSVRAKGTCQGKGKGRCSTRPERA